MEPVVYEDLEHSVMLRAFPDCDIVHGNKCRDTSGLLNLVVVPAMKEMAKNPGVILARLEYEAKKGIEVSFDTERSYRNSCDFSMEKLATCIFKNEVGILRHLISIRDNAFSLNTCLEAENELRGNAPFMRYRTIGQELAQFATNFSAATSVFRSDYKNYYPWDMKAIVDVSWKAVCNEGYGSDCYMQQELCWKIGQSSTLYVSRKPSHINVQSANRSMRLPDVKEFLVFGNEAIKFWLPYINVMIREMANIGTVSSNSTNCILKEHAE